MALTAVMVLSFGDDDAPVMDVDDAHGPDDGEVTGDMGNIIMDIGGRTFEIVLDGNETSRALLDILPLDARMNDLNGNEKYMNLDGPLPVDPQRVGRIQAGDVMLYGDDCLVVFYESFSTGYSYTPIGHISDVSGLREALGNGSANVSFTVS